MNTNHDPTNPNQNPNPHPHPEPHPTPDPRPNPPTVPNPDPNQPRQPEVPQIDPPEVVPPSIPEKPDLPPMPHSEVDPKDVRVPESPVFDPEVASSTSPEVSNQNPEERAGDAGNREQSAREDNAYEWSEGGDDIRELVIEPPMKHDSDARPQ